jgi:hypothetical protein
MTKLISAISALLDIVLMLAMRIKERRLRDEGRKEARLATLEADRAAARAAKAIEERVSRDPGLDALRERMRKYRRP